MKFRRRAKLFPGVYLNFSKSGISTTIGIRGASINIGSKGTYINTGIPGTGLYDRQRIDGSHKVDSIRVPKSESINEDTGALFAVPEESIEHIKSKSSESTTTEGLNGLKKMLMECYQERIDLRDEIKSAKAKLVLQTILMIFSYLILVGLVIKWFRDKRVEIKNYLVELSKQLENCFVDIDIQLDPQFESLFKEVHDALIFSKFISSLPQP